jgi:hypothetical protein
MLRYEILFSDGRMVSANFADILPLATLIVDGFGGASSTTSVMYTGSMPPATRVHQLAAFRENFIESRSQYRWCRGSFGKSKFLFFPLCKVCMGN